MSLKQQNLGDRRRTGNGQKTVIQPIFGKTLRIFLIINIRFVITDVRPLIRGITYSGSYTEARLNELEDIGPIPLNS